MFQLPSVITQTNKIVSVASCCYFPCAHCAGSHTDMLLVMQYSRTGFPMQFPAILVALIVYLLCILFGRHGRLPYKLPITSKPSTRMAGEDINHWSLNNVNPGYCLCVVQASRPTNCNLIRMELKIRCADKNKRSLETWSTWCYLN